MIVIDASAMLEALLRTAAAKAVGSRIFGAGQSLHAPHLLDLEIAQVLGRYAAQGELRAERVNQALADLGEMPVRRYAHDFLLPRIWELRGNLTAYDAAYVALSEILDAPLLTRDKRLAAAAGHRARIDLV